MSASNICKSDHRTYNNPAEQKQEVALYLLNDLLCSLPGHFGYPSVPFPNRLQQCLVSLRCRLRTGYYSRILRPVRKSDRLCHYHSISLDSGDSGKLIFPFSICNTSSQRASISSAECETRIIVFPLSFNDRK